MERTHENAWSWVAAASPLPQSAYRCMGMSDFYGDRDDGQSPLQQIHCTLDLRSQILRRGWCVCGPYTNEELVGGAPRGRATTTAGGSRQNLTSCAIRRQAEQKTRQKRRAKSVCAKSCEARPFAASASRRSISTIGTASIKANCNRKDSRRHGAIGERRQSVGLTDGGRKGSKR